MNRLIPGLALTVFLLASHPAVHAQDKAELGTRTGGTSGAMGHFFLGAQTAVGGILGTFGNGYSLTGYFLSYEPIYVVRGLYVFRGVGLHASIYNGDNRYNHYYQWLGRGETHHTRNELGFGIDGILGAEFRMPNGIPLVFSADIKPFAEVSGKSHVTIAPDPSIGIRILIR